ncbi:hypothetical protein T281_08605 [Rhodomicrobium udaipurense JA643]|nr:hypothetical protein T281_08605 [Rhodomicrobium udaipurense JA643]
MSQIRQADRHAPVYMVPRKRHQTLVPQRRHQKLLPRNGNESWCRANGSERLDSNPHRIR